MKNFFRKFWKATKSLNLKEKSVIIALLLLIVIQGVNISAALKVTTGEIVATEGGNYTEGLAGQINHLNPLLITTNEAERDITQLIFSSLVKFDPTTQKMVDDLANYELSEDQLTYTFTLKDNVTWHDGAPLTAEDVYFTYSDLIQNQNFPNQLIQDNFKGVDIEKIDDKTITFTLDEPNNFFISNMNVGIVPKHILGERDVRELLILEFNKKPIGSGPYKFVQSTTEGAQTNVILTSYEDYFDETPLITELKLTVLQNHQDILAQRAKFNGIPKVPGAISEDIKQDERFELIPYTLPQYAAIFFNTESELLQDDKIRLALSKSVNKDELLAKLTDKQRIDTPLLELADQSEWILQPNLEQAQGALFDSGWIFESDSDFYRTKDERTLSVKLLVRDYDEGNPLQIDNNIVIDHITQTWQEIGVELIVEREPYENWSQKLVDRDYDIILHGQNLGYNLDTYSYWHSTQATAAGSNLSNYKSFEADTLIEDIRTTFEEESKQELLTNLDSVIATDIPAIFLYTPIYYYASDGKIKNIDIKKLAFPSDRFTDINKWYIREMEI